VKSSFSAAVITRALANLTAVGTSFVSIRLYNLYVSKEVYGAILVGLGITSYLPIFSSGFRMALNQQVLAESDAAEARQIATFSQTLQTYFLLIVLVLAVSVMAVYSQVPSARHLGISMPVFLVTGAAAALIFHAGAQLGMLVAFGEQVVSTILQTMWGVFQLLILWLAFRSGVGVWAFPASIGGSALLTILLARLAMDRAQHNIPMLLFRAGPDFRERLGRVWTPSLDGLRNQLATALIYNLDLILVGLLVGAGEAAVYGVLTRIAGLSRMALNAMSEAAWPRLAQQQDATARAKMMRTLDRLNAWSAGCWYGAMAATLHAFLGWFIKADWVASPTLVGLVVVRFFVVSLATPHNYGLMSAGKFQGLALISQREVIVLATLGPLLTWYYGSLGTAVAFLIGALTVSGWQTTHRYFQDAVGTHWLAEWRAIYARGLVGGVVALGLAAGIWSLGQRVHAPGWAALLAGGLGYVLPLLPVAYWRLRTGEAP
jgi:O-antigen/teichoic acid export membrane protein